MASSTIYERFPSFLDAELEDLDLSTSDAAVRDGLRLAFNAERNHQAREAAKDRAFAAAKRAAGIA